MSLIDDARNLAASKPKGHRCHVAEAIATHPDLADEIRELLSEATIGPTLAAETFKRHGIHLTAFTVSRHRSGSCTYCNSGGGA